MSRTEQRPYVIVGQGKRHFQKAIEAFKREHDNCIVLGIEDPDCGDAPREDKEHDVD